MTTRVIILIFLFVALFAWQLYELHVSNKRSPQEGVTRLEIRKIEPTSINEVHALALATPELIYANGLEFMSLPVFSKQAISPTCLILSAHCDNRIVGFIYAELIRTEWASICYFAVNPEYRQRGIGGALLRHCSRYLKEMGRLHIYTFANTGSPGAVKMCKQAGLKICKTYHSMYCDL